MEKLNLTAVILTHNEELHISRCIESVSQIAADVVVVDSFSNDNTAAIARELGARVFSNPWINYATQFQWALDHTDIQSDWILRIDADEYIEPELHRLLREKLPSLPASITGLYVQRKYLFLGRWMRHGAMHPINVLRLWRRGAGRIEQRWMDEHIVLNHGEALQLDGAIADDNLNSISWWINKHNAYATREMIDLLNLRYNFLPKDDQLEVQTGKSQAAWRRRIKERTYARLPLFVRPMAYFVYRYFFKLGFLDGLKGFAFTFMQALWYRTLADLKVMEAEEWIKSCETPQEIRAVLAQKTGLKL